MLRLLQRVTCPPDMGQAAYKGRVMAIDDKESSHMGRKFKWVTVDRLDDSGTPTGQKSIWPSHRLT